MNELGEKVLFDGVLHLFKSIIIASVLHLIIKAPIKDEYKLIISIVVLYVITLEIKAHASPRYE